MKPSIYLQISLLLICAAGTSQNNHFSIERPSIKKIADIEKANHGNAHWSPSHVEYTPAPGEIPNSDRYHFAQPISSLRHTRPWATYAQYYYSVPDSVVRKLEYDWTLDDTTSAIFLFNANANQFDKLFGEHGKIFIDKRPGEGGFGRAENWGNNMVQVKQILGAGMPDFRKHREYHLLIFVNFK